MVELLLAGAITVFGAGFAAFKLEPSPKPELGFSPDSARRPAVGILLVFVALTTLFGLITVVRYRDTILKNTDQLIFVAWLALVMIAGMFVQVLASNYRSGNPLLSVSASQLLYPLLFAIVVFYPIWALAASAPKNFFVIHAAFLNGYFWESVVSSAKVPEKP
jgi:hypothetical protein